MIINFHIGPVRTQMTNTQKMNSSEMSTQKMNILHVCSTDKSKSKSIKSFESKSHVCYTYKSEPKRVIFNACIFDKIESKSFHISVNASEVKDSMNETNDEEPSVTDNSVVNAPSYFKISD